MRVAWPELIVLIVAVALTLLAAEIGILAVAKEFHVTGWIVGPAAIVMLLGDIWIVLRAIDWAFAGPARRARQRIL